jgi:protein-disulfide isomerase
MKHTALRDRKPLLFGLIAFLIIAAVGIYLFVGADQAETTTDIAADASSDAEAAIAAAGISKSERAAIEAIVRAYILENPEIITEAVQILQKRDVVQRVQSAGGALTTPFPGAVAGNPEGAITIVEFTDYNCGFCRASLADIDRLIAGNKDIRVIFREVPILAESSRDGARWALAAARQGKYKAFHDALFAGGPVSEKSIRAAAARAGLNISQAEKDAASAEIKAELDANRSMMQQIGFGGTPTFFIGDQMIEGAVGYDALKAAVEKARKKG